MLFKLVCMSIFCIFCSFEHAQLPTVAAVPFEYNEDHEQYPYDLDTEQSKAKYDARLLSQQFRQVQELFGDGKGQYQTERQDGHHEEEKEEEKSEHVSRTDGGNDGNEDDDDNDDDDMQPHERAASCYTGEHKYTHGQKVPRSDPCEVCLCMDGEIFCWWEKCEKRKPSIFNLNNGKHAAKSHHNKKSVKKSKMASTAGPIQPNGKSSRNKIQIRNGENQRTFKSLKKQLYQQNPHSQIQFDEKQHEEYNSRRQQHQTMHQAMHQAQHRQSQQQLEKSNKHEKHFSSPTSVQSSSKIMNFPENLPSVLYYDYHTEEHEHHQHQHHQQHLKHQMQKKIQQMQMQMAMQRDQQRDWQQKAFKKAFINETASLLTTPPVPVPIPVTMTALMQGQGQGQAQAHQQHSIGSGISRSSASSPAMLAYDDSQTDSDILPEPPTKKPKLLLPAASNAFTDTIKLTPPERNATTIERKESNLYGTGAGGDIGPIVRNKWSSGNSGGVHRLFIGETSATSSIIATDDVIEINKNVNPRKNPTLKAFNVQDDEANSSSDDEDKDDAFHRWLTSTENYNSSNSNKNKSDKDDDVEREKDNRSKNGSVNEANFSADGNENFFATESSEFENPFGIQDLSKYSNKNKKDSSDSKNNTENNRSNKVLHPRDRDYAQNPENGFLRGVFSNDYSDYNGSVVNIDILLTTQDELRQQKQQQQQSRELIKQATVAAATEEGAGAGAEPLPKRPASIKFAAGLILNRDGVEELPKRANETKMRSAEMGGSTPESNPQLNSNQSKLTTTSTMKVNDPTATGTTAPPPYVTFMKENNSETVEGVGTTAAAVTTTMRTERHCNVMGTLYKIGEVLPQDTGNCLQCICIDGSTKDDTPRVTCSPHNCPPLVLPDLFDATGY